jgi:hypothetical protein
MRGAVEPEYTVGEAGDTSALTTRKGLLCEKSKPVAP